MTCSLSPGFALAKGCCFVNFEVFRARGFINGVRWALSSAIAGGDFRAGSAEWGGTPEAFL